MALDRISFALAAFVQRGFCGGYAPHKPLIRFEPERCCHAASGRLRILRGFEALDRDKAWAARNGSRTRAPRGRPAIRTDFLLRCLGTADLRRTIGVATNKSELFKRYT